MVTSTIGVILSAALVGSSVGILLSILGAGGAIIAVPAFTIIFNHPPKLAITEGLITVLAVSSFASSAYLRKSLVAKELLPTLVITGFIGAQLGTFFGSLVSGKLQMFFLGLVLFLAGFLILQRKSVSKNENRKIPYLLQVVFGIGAGLLTGFLGVGGGFIIVPTLNRFFHLPMKIAVGTSLTIVAINSFAAIPLNLIDTYRQGFTIPLLPISVVLAAALLSSWRSTSLAPYISEKITRFLFALLLLSIGIYNLIQHSM
jgi:uncharacterized membrane protein YfcA